jgi:predicted nuclease of restriction endonuclease-like RecB superfamily
MLSSELLVTRVRGDEISPLFIMPEGDHLELARDLIGIFGDHTGKKLGELNDILEEMEDQGFDYRLVRGLVSLLERRCDLRVESTVEPAAARRAVFSAAASTYPVVTSSERVAAIREAATALCRAPEDIEQAMYADLENELVLASFRPPPPDDLVYHYNLSLAQTLLFKATQLKFRASAGHKDVLRQVKRLGLMYDAEYNDGRVDITVDGPASAMKLTERYGTALARLLPFITASEGWNVEAAIVRKDFSGAPRVYKFVLSQRKHGDLFRTWPEEPVEFDSALEEAFYGAFAGFNTGWSISREPEPLITGKWLYIPDFLLEKDDMRVYVEIAGFWTPEYLRRKVAKLKEIRDRELIVLADEKTSCEAFREVPDVIFFDRKVPLKPVIHRLNEIERTHSAAGASKLEQSSLHFDGDVIRLSDLAAEAGVSVESMRMYLEQHPPDGYLWAGDELISDRLLREIEDVLPQTMPYAEAVTAIKQKGITSADTVIKKLGYAVKWSGLDPDSAMINKIK